MGRPGAPGRLWPQVNSEGIRPCGGCGPTQTRSRRGVSGGSSAWGRDRGVGSSVRAAEVPQALLLPGLSRNPHPATPWPSLLTPHRLTGSAPLKRRPSRPGAGRAIPSCPGPCRAEPSLRNRPATPPAVGPGRSIPWNAKADRSVLNNRPPHRRRGVETRDRRAAGQRASLLGQKSLDRSFPCPFPWPGPDPGNVR